MAKSFEDYAAEHAKKPFPLPMPDGKTIPVRQPSLLEERAAVSATEEYGGELEALIAYAGTEHAGAIREAWGTMPRNALIELFADMRKFWGRGN